MLNNIIEFLLAQEQTLPNTAQYRGLKKLLQSLTLGTDQQNKSSESSILFYIFHLTKCADMALAILQTRERINLDNKNLDEFSAVALIYQVCSTVSTMLVPLVEEQLNQQLVSYFEKILRYENAPVQFITLAKKIVVSSPTPEKILCAFIKKQGLLSILILCQEQYEKEGDNNEQLQKDWNAVAEKDLLNIANKFTDTQRELLSSVDVWLKLFAEVKKRAEKHADLSQINMTHSTLLESQFNVIYSNIKPFNDLVESVGRADFSRIFVPYPGNDDENHETLLRLFALSFFLFDAAKRQFFMDVVTCCRTIVILPGRDPVKVELSQQQTTYFEEFNQALMSHVLSFEKPLDECWQLASTLLSKTDWMRIAVLWRSNLSIFDAFQRQEWYQEVVEQKKSTILWSLIELASHPRLASSQELAKGQTLLYFLLFTLINLMDLFDQFIDKNIEKGIIPTLLVVIAMSLAGILALTMYLQTMKFLNINVETIRKVGSLTPFIGGGLLYTGYLYSIQPSPNLFASVSMRYPTILVIVHMLIQDPLPLFVLQRSVLIFLTAFMFLSTITSDMLGACYFAVLLQATTEMGLMLLNKALSWLEEPFFLENLKQIAPATTVKQVKGATVEEVTNTQKSLQKALLTPPGEKNASTP